MAAAAPVGDGVVPFDGAHTMLLPCVCVCVRAIAVLLWHDVFELQVKTFLIGSDDSGEGNQGRTMATEYGLAPLAGAAISLGSFESVLPELCSPFPRMLRSAALVWKSDTLYIFHVIRSRKLVSF